LLTVKTMHFLYSQGRRDWIALWAASWEASWWLAARPFPASTMRVA